MRRAADMRLGFAALLLLTCVVSGAHAAAIAPAPLGSLDQQASAKPGALENVTIEQHLGQKLPLDAKFHDENGKEVRIGDYFGEGKRPAVLVMAYYECPMLCTLVLNGTIKALRPMNLKAGTDFDLVVVSINPNETPELALKKKQTYAENYSKQGDGGGFHFLTGEEASIRAVADAVGFRYNYLPETKEYAHAAAIYVLTPAGELSRYFFGVEFSGRDLRLALVEAAGGKIGNFVDQLMLFCFRYDPSAGKYSAAALAIVRLGGVATALSLAGFIGLSRWRETHPPEPRS